jgi:hypothetical protein
MKPLNCRFGFPPPDCGSFERFAYSDDPGQLFQLEAGRLSDLKPAICSDLMSAIFGGIPLGRGS